MSGTNRASANQLKEATEALIAHSCPVARDERVLILCAEGTEASVRLAFEQTVSRAGAEARSFRVEERGSSSDGPDCALDAALAEADLVVEITKRYQFHRPEIRAALQQGIRYACYSQLDSDYLATAIVDTAAYQRQLESDRAFARALLEAPDLTFTSPLGTDLRIDMRKGRIDIAGGAATGPGMITYLAGQVSLYPKPESLNGVIVCDGRIQHVAPPSTPVQVEIREGLATAITGGESGRELSEWLAEQADPGVYAGSHLSIGLNALVREPACVVAAERQLGSLVLGLGAQPPGLGIFGESRVCTAAHTDLIAERITLRIGAMPWIENGRLRAVEDLLVAERDPGG